MKVKSHSRSISDEFLLKRSLLKSKTRY